MSEQATKKHWSEWYAWDKDDIYDTIYVVVPSNNWNTVDIELVLKDGRVDKACMCPYEEYTEDEVKKQDPPKQKDKAEDIISTFIVNQLGINLLAVRDIQVDRQIDGQIKQIKIDFIPDNN